MKNKIVLLIVILLLSSCTNKDIQVDDVNIEDVVTYLNSVENGYCDVLSYTEVEENYINDIIKFDFVGADFYFNKLSYTGNNSDSFYVHTMKLQGNEIDIHYIYEDDDEISIYNTDDYSELPYKTIYIKTDLEYLILSVPSVYDKNRIYDSIQTNPDYEKSIDISHYDGTYYITYALPENGDFISEFFYVKSNENILEFNEITEELLVKTDLSDRFRLLADGFYQQSYETYYPNGVGSYFRNSANYIGYHFLDYNLNVALEDRVKYFDYISYASTYVVNSQMSSLGFFETKSRSNWLYQDFFIDDGFYDTRFNADNGEVNIMAYKIFGDEYFLETLNRYGEFFINYVDEYSYKTDRGILVDDYYNPKGGERTHSSLNHHIASMNLLISMYQINNNIDYWDTAMLMLYGVEDTIDEWIMEDNNLEYALYYNGTNNTMVDYPYLTYNDLYVARERLSKVNVDTSGIEKLMAAKKTYMDNNNITGYKK